MNLAIVNPKPNNIHSCLGCKKTMQSGLEVVYVDLEGEAFYAYYCETCRRILENVKIITDEELERTWCRSAGEVGHTRCGYCNKHRKPCWECGCLFKKGEKRG